MSVNSKMTAIADVIRERTGETGLLNLDQMPAAIASIKGGGAEMNAIAAASLPATVTDGQIVVITSTPAGTIYVDTDEPANPVSGDVWVVVGSSDYGVDFSESFRNGLNKAQQYINGLWELRAGYLGLSSTWRQFATALPPKGTPLANWTWAQIVALSNSEEDATQYFSVGDEKVLSISPGGDIPMVIGAFNHNTISGTSKKAQMAFTAKILLPTKNNMNSQGTNVGGWGGCGMRNSHLAGIFNTFPAELRADGAIKYVDTVTSAGNMSKDLVTSSDRLRLLSLTEMGLTLSYAATGEGSTYAYYSAGNRVKNLNGSATTYWTRTPTTTANTDFCTVTTAGKGGGDTANKTFGVALAFDI